MSEKQLLIESCDFSFSCNLSDEKKTALTESLKISAGKNGNLIVKSIPCTILDRRNANGRIYPTALMQKAIDEAKPKMRAKMLLCSGDEHPVDSTFPRPSSVSHCVINAYIKNVEIEVEGKKERHNVLFNDWEILNEHSQIGAQVQQLILSGFSVGTSIRSIGSCDPDGTVTDLEYWGTDLVGQPSSATFVNSVIGESVEVSAAPLTETYVVSASATNVVRDLDSALALSQQIDSANFGTVKKTSTKLDSEVDPKTGAETTMVTLETETEDEVSELDQALAMAKQAMMNGKADIDSVTIENVKEEQPKESVEDKDTPVLNEEEKDPTYLALKKSNYYRFNTPEEYMQFINDNAKYLDNGYSLPGAEKIFAEYTDGKISPELACHELEGFIGNITNKTFDEYIPESEMSESEANQVENPEKRAERAVQMQYNFIVSNTQEADPERQQAENIFAKFEQGQASAIDTREALYNIASGLQKKLWGESKDTEYNTHEFTPKGVDWIYDSVISLMWNDGLTLEQACRKFCEQNDNIPYEYLLEYMRTAPMEESMNDPVSNAKSSFTAINAYHQHYNDVPGIEEIYNQAKEVMNKLEQKEIDATKGAEILDKLHHEGIQKILHHGFGESTITEETNHIAEDIRIAFENLPDVIKAYPKDHELHIRAEDLLNRLKQCYWEGAFIPDSPIEDILNDCYDLFMDYQNDMLKDWREKSLKGESTITEAKEEKQEDPNKGKQYVLKTNQGFVAMDGNAISFVDNPKDAIHFVKGNEESGVIHLSGINKILNTMGILDSDIEKYFKKDSIDISAHDDVNVQAAESDGVKVEECGTTPMTEENGSNTRFKATVKINGANGESTEDVPVSAVDMEGINAEVANLYDMKKQKADGELSVIVTDTASGQQFMLNPETRQIELMNTQMESAGDIEQDGNKLSMEVDDDNKVEKEFNTPAQAAVAKAGIESGKLGGDVLLSEDDTSLDDDDEESDTAKCAWCGEEFEKSALRKEKDLGYLCNTCARGIESREGPLTFEEADDEIPVKTDYSYENIEPGWYASAPSVGIVGPYDTEEELRAVLGKEVCEIADSDKGLVNIDYVEDDNALAAESAKIDEVMFNEPGEASDPFIEKPLKDSVGNVIVEVDNINWDNEDLYNNFLANYEPGDPVIFNDIESKVKDLPSSTVVKINMDELPDNIDSHTFKNCVLDSLGKTYAMRVNDADIISVNYIN